MLAIDQRMCYTLHGCMNRLFDKLMGHYLRGFTMLVKIVNKILDSEVWSLMAGMGLFYLATL